MDNRHHSQPHDDLSHVAASSSLMDDDGINSNRDNNISPSTNRPPAHPATPGAVGENADSYFEALREAPSAAPSIAPSEAPSAAPSGLSFSSRTSRRRSAGPSALRPPIDQTRLPSIQIRRKSGSSLGGNGNDSRVHFPPPPSNLQSHDDVGGRARSISQPERAQIPDNANLARHSRRVPQIAMPRLTEEGGRPSLAELGIDPSRPLSPAQSLPERSASLDATRPDPPRTRMQRARNMSRIFWPGHYRREGHQQTEAQPEDPDDVYAQELVDWLDTIDPEVQTLSTLTNVQNSLFVPDLGHWVNRRPTYVLSDQQQQFGLQRARTSTLPSRLPDEAEREEAATEAPATEDAPPMQRSNTITSRLTDSHYAALPHGTTLEGWTAADKLELDDHVRHMLHSRRSRMKRRLKGFGQYIRRPLGFFVTLYAVLITLFGLAWVLFLIGWIYVGERQPYIIHVIDSVLVALFAIMGDGLAPFRAIDTYHMIFVARLSRKIVKRERGEPPRTRLQKRNIPPEIRESMDLQAMERTSSSQQPDDVLLQDPHRSQAPRNSSGLSVQQTTEAFPDLEETISNSESEEFDSSYLSYAQRQKLAHHQKKLAKSHSFYKPYETYTHYPYPLKYLIAIVVLLDCHSLLQISLGATTWGIDWRIRPMAITTVILCVSIACNITAGLLISIGDRKSRKKDIVELLDRQELTGDAIKKMEIKKKKEEEKNSDSSKEQSLKEERSIEKADESESRLLKLTKRSS